MIFILWNILEVSCYIVSRKLTSPFLCTCMPSKQDLSVGSSASGQITIFNKTSTGIYFPLSLAIVTRSRHGWVLFLPAAVLVMEVDVAINKLNYEILKHCHRQGFLRMCVCVAGGNRWVCKKCVTSVFKYLNMLQHSKHSNICSIVLIFLPGCSWEGCDLNSVKYSVLIWCCCYVRYFLTNWHYFSMLPMR